MAWVYLVVAGLFEIAWAFGLKASAGLTRPGATAVTALCVVISFAFLGLALRTLPLSTAYAMWTGIGTVGAAAVGILVLGEAAGPWRVACLALIATGIVGLKFAPPG